MTTAARTEGERWARDELCRLRDLRFTLAAVTAFLGSSHRRSRQTRLERPELARRATRWEVIGAAATIAAAGLRRPRDGAFAVRAGAWWAAVALMVEWHLGMVESEDGEPRNLGPADALTLSRAWMVPFIARRAHPAVIALAAATDVLDGVAARATVPTRAGRDLEGLVDAAIGIAALAGLRRDGRVSRPTGRLEKVRLAGGVGYALHSYFTRAQPPRAALVRAARATTPVRVTGLVLAAAGHRRAGQGLLAAGSLASLALLATAAGDEVLGDPTEARRMRPDLDTNLAAPRAAA